MEGAGAQVEDVVLYDNWPCVPPAATPAARRANRATLPLFDAVHFASASAVEVFLAAYGARALTGKTKPASLYEGKQSLKSSLLLDASTQFFFKNFFANP